MAEWWEQAPVVDAPEPSNWWAVAPMADGGAPREREMGMLWPVSWNADDGSDYSFDSNAGLVGAIKRAITLPGEAMRGEVDPLSAKGIGRAAEFASVASPMTPGLRAGSHVIPGVLSGATKKARVEAPSAHALRAAAEEGYENLRSLDARYTSKSISDMAATLEQSLFDKGINDKVAKNTIATLRELQNPASDSFATSTNVETIRRAFGKIGEDFSNPTDQGAGKFARGAVDDFLASPPPGSVVPGTEEAAAEAGRIAANARGNFASSKRSGRLAALTESAEDRAGASNSGHNIGNSIRQRAATIVGSPKLSSGFSKDELAALRSVARGTAPQNLTRHIGNLLGGGGGLGQAFTAIASGTGAAAATGNPYAALFGIVPPALGAGAKSASNAMTKKALAAVDKATRMRSPLYEQMLKEAPDVPVMPVGREQTAAAIRAMLLGLQAQNGGGGW